MSTRSPLVPPAAQPGTTVGPPADAGQQGLLGSLARTMARNRRTVMLAWLAVTLIAAPFAVTLNGALSGAGWDAQGSTAQKVRSELRTNFAGMGAEAAIVVYVQPNGTALSDPGLGRLVDSLAKAPGAARVVDPRTMPAEAGLSSRDGHTVLIPVALKGGKDVDLPESAGRLGTFVRSQSLTTGAKANVTGEWSVWSDFNKENEEALHKAELLSGLPSMILLLVAFGSALAAGIPLVLAVAGIAAGFATLHLVGITMPVSVWAMNFSMMIGLAVGIDYSLFIVSRYREERAEGHDATEAIGRTLSTAGKAVFLSAVTVMASLAAVFVVPVMVFRSMALGMILSVAAVMVASLTLLPAVLVALGDRVLETRGERKREVSAEGRWARWTAHATNKPGLVLTAGVALLLALGAPALGIRLGMPGARVVDPGRTSRDGYEAVVSAFGPGAAAPLYITTPVTGAAKVVEVAKADSAVVDARIVAEPSPAGRTVVRVIGKTPVDDLATSRLVARLRTGLRTAVPAALVGGPAAQNHDLTAVLTSRAPLAVGIIVAIAFILLLVVFRSLALSIASIVLNLLSVGAAFGFATLVFQHGFGAGLLGIHHQGFVDAWAPLFFFALLFGLSMDYQLFLLAAIREHYEATGDTRLAIREGVSRTGKPITNAALVMIVVFVAFGVTGPIPPTELGVTLALAVLIDATIVRMMIVPSLMTLLGDRNWYLPAWLDKVLPVVKFAH
jgi:putative drug exporter of the RND superfamily